eukprot:TRINITY_DN2620_c0_g1_i1.p1 TRINITY_DN2620_c0_g1~~TRINITY_DN2620_c0_g1_i1.p1  ORF type:complete len:765 (+),score=150.69 TRINITY_DN2620_c0_g1_i1:91-2295(+)
MALATMSAAQIESALTPAPSVSRTGKMAASAMHTDALVRSGVAALQKRKKKNRRRKVITASDVVDPTTVDSFGTAEPGLDSARCREVCSSPRGHPDVQLQRQLVEELDRTGAFAAKMEIKPPPGSPPVQRSGRVRRARVVSPSGMPPLSQKEATALFHAAAEDSRSPRSRQLVLPELSACFRTAPRFGDHQGPPNPPVGHYRPKFTAVDGSLPAALVRGKSPHPTPRKWPPHPQSPQSARSPKHPPRQPPAEPAPQAQPPAQPPAAQDRPAGAAPGKPLAPQPPAEPPGATGRGAHYDKWVARQRGRDRVTKNRGSPCFLSKWPSPADRPVPPTVSPDKFYSPYNEAMVSTRSGTARGAHLDTYRQTGRGVRIMFKGHCTQSEGPAVTYDPPDDGLRARAAYGFDAQVPRTKAAADAQGMASRRHYALNCAATELAPLHKFPASHIDYDTSAAEKLSYRRTDVVLPFAKATTREQQPTEVQRPRPTLDPVEPYAPQHTERTTGGHRPQTLFDKQASRPAHMCNPINDLEYDVSPTARGRRAPCADLDRTAGHESLFHPSITTACDYAPNLAAVKPRASQGPSMDKNPGRGDDAARGVPAAQMMDRFYETEPTMRIKLQGQEEVIPLTVPRVKGNPMIQRHMSREKRQAITSVRQTGPDRFYDVDVSKVRPNLDRRAVDFRRGLGRDDCSVGRLLPMSPRRQAEAERAPGFIYEPQLGSVSRHVPSAQFGLASAR